jgi:plasmid stabilization system protein ParE
LDNALNWYESQSEGLEQRFSKDINERLSFITTYPEASPVRIKNFRGAQLKKFPYTIYYVFDEGLNVVRVVAVLHNKRDKNVLTERKI